MFVYTCLHSHLLLDYIVRAMCLQACMYTYVTYTYKYTEVTHTCIYSEYSTRVYRAHAVLVYTCIHSHLLLHYIVRALCL